MPYNNYKKRILISGSAGQLGQCLQNLASNYPDYEFIFTTRQTLALDKLSTIQPILTQLQPNYIINCAAFTNVEQAEQQSLQVDLINHLAVAEIASWCKKMHCKLIQISSDYVFNSRCPGLLNEKYPTNPINLYGKSKLKAEQIILNLAAEAIIIRTAWLYSIYSDNFVTNILKLAQQQPQLKVVNDQFGSPTYAPDLAHAIMTIIGQENFTPNLYHYANNGSISRYEWGQKILTLAKLNCKLLAIPSTELITLAARPFNSSLANSKIKQQFNLPIPNWITSLTNCLNEYNLVNN